MATYKVESFLDMLPALIAAFLILLLFIRFFIALFKAISLSGRLFPFYMEQYHPKEWARLKNDDSFSAKIDLGFYSRGLEYWKFKLRSSRSKRQ